MPFTLESDTKRRKVDSLTRRVADALYYSKNSPIVATKSYVSAEIDKYASGFTESDIISTVKKGGFTRTADVTAALSVYSKSTEVDVALVPYAKTSALVGFVTSDDITTALDPYARTDDVSRIESAYAKTETINTEIAKLAKETELPVYAKTEDVDLKFGLYAKTSAVDSELVFYATTPSLEAYATTSSVNTKLNDYATTLSVDSYATKLSLDSYATTDSLASYVTMASLNPYATKIILGTYQKTADAIVKDNVLAYVDEAGYAKKTEIRGSTMSTATIDKLFLTCNTAGARQISYNLGPIPYTVNYIGTTKELTPVQAQMCYHGKIDRQFIFNRCNSLVHDGIRVPAGMWNLTLQFNIVRTNDNWLKFSNGRLSLCYVPANTYAYYIIEPNPTTALYNDTEPYIVRSDLLQTMDYGYNAGITAFHDMRFADAPCQMFLDPSIDLTVPYPVNRTFHLSVLKEMFIYPCLYLESNNAASPSKETNAFTGRRYPPTHYPFYFQQLLADDVNTLRLDSAEENMLKIWPRPPYTAPTIAGSGIGAGGRACFIKKEPNSQTIHSIYYKTHLELSADNYGTADISHPGYLPMCQLAPPHTSAAPVVVERTDDRFLSMPLNPVGFWYLERLS